MALTETAGTSNGTPTTGSGITPAGIYPFGASFVSGEFTVFSVQLRSAGAGASSLIPSWTKIATRQQFYPAGAGTYYTLETWVRRQTTTRIQPVVSWFGSGVSWTWGARTYYGTSSPAIVSSVGITGRDGTFPTSTSYSLSTSVTSTAGGQLIRLSAFTSAPVPDALPGTVLTPGAHSATSSGSSPLPAFLEAFILGDAAWVPPGAITAAGRLLTHRIIHPPALQKRF